MTWLKLTLTNGEPSRVNSDNILSYGANDDPEGGSYLILLGAEMTSYVQEPPERIDVMLGIDKKPPNIANAMVLLVELEKSIRMISTRDRADDLRVRDVLEKLQQARNMIMRTNPEDSSE